jgi:serine/threonine protein phosphatase 1
VGLAATRAATLGCLLMVSFSLAPGRLAPGRRIYAIGDVHGCVDRLAELHREIADDLAARPVVEPLLIHLGDYVDRGPDSAGVVAMLAGGGGPSAAILPMVNLKGNHEAMMLEAFDGAAPQARLHWLRNGGGAALASWNLEPTASSSVWRHQLPPAQLGFLRGLALMHRVDNYLFVHAGIRPGIALDRQVEEDLLWIREPFLNHAGDFGFVVVHGHTPMPVPTIRPNRIGIDTGAVLGGALTCAVLEADRVAFIKA